MVSVLNITKSFLRKQLQTGQLSLSSWKPLLQLMRQLERRGQRGGSAQTHILAKKKNKKHDVHDEYFVTS